MSNGDDIRPPGDQPDSLSQPETSSDAGAPEPEPVVSGGAPDDGIIDKAIKVLTDPVGFYKWMDRSGGYQDPLVFTIVLALVSGVISAAFAMFDIGVRGAVIGGFGAIILIPILVTIFSFIAAGIFWVIWKVMGSGENYETAYRCVAYSSGIGPAVTVLGIIPSIGSIVSAVWPMALMAIASIHVHKRGEKISWSVFGALALFMIAINLAGEQAAV